MVVFHVLNCANSTELRKASHIKQYFLLLDKTVNNFFSEEARATGLEPFCY